MLYLVDPKCMVLAILANASNNVYCTLLAHSAIHGAMVGYTSFIVGLLTAHILYIISGRSSLFQESV